MLLSEDISVSEPSLPVRLTPDPPKGHAPVAPAAPVVSPTEPSVSLPAPTSTEPSPSDQSSGLDPNLRIDYGALATTPGSDAEALKAIRDTMRDLQEPVQVKVDENEEEILVQCSELAMNKIVQKLQHSGIRWVNLKPAK